MTDHKAHVRVLKSLAVAYEGETGAALRAAIAALTAAPAASEGEDGAVAWIKPDWQNPANFDGKSPVTTYRINGWLPLYTRSAAQVAVAPADAALVRDAMQAVPLGYFNSTGGHSQQENRDAVADALVSALAAVEVAATPKHDEGREADALADRLQRMARNIEANNMTRDRPSGFGRELVDLFDIAATTIRTLATQPAARRVTDEDAAIRLLVAAGYITEANASKALNIAQGLAPGPLPKPAQPLSEADLRWCEDTAEALKEAGGSTNNMHLIALNRLIAAARESFAQPAEGVSGG